MRWFRSLGGRSASCEERSPKDDEGSAATNTGGELYADFIRSELEQERTRRASIDTRAASVITTSGTLVTLAFALTALFTKEQNYKPSTVVTVFLGLALAAFIAAAAIALVSTRLRVYSVVHPDQLDTWREDRFWLDDQDNARWLLADANTKTLASLREGSDSKAREVQLALWAQFVAFGFLSLAALTILIEAMV